MVRDLKKEIGNDAEGLVEKIREYSRSQVDLWQQVPFLAYLCPKYVGKDEKDRKTIGQEKFSKIDNLGTVSLEGYLPVGKLIYTGSGLKSYYTVLIDLETGKLVEGDANVICLAKARKPAKNDHVLALADYIDELDAEKLVTRLKSKVSRRSFYDSEKREEWLDLYRSIERNSVIKNQPFLDTTTL